MSDFVRVKDNETAHEYSVSEDRYDASPDLFTKLDKPATDSIGEPLPVKYKVSLKAEKPATVAPKR